jgi:23S rRNA pseudouridine1911/1915/1917 synthase
MSTNKSAVIRLSFPATRELWEVPVLFEDDHLLALNKPTGLLVSADRRDLEKPNLIKLLHAAIADGLPWVKQRGLSYVMNAHRLDSETSGVILLAKSKSALVYLANLFGTETPIRKYLALVRGDPAQEQFEVDAKLAPNTVQLGLMRVDPKGGKRSRTKFQVMERFSRWTLLRCEPLTDRTHQIRVHLRYVGCPLVGDRLYGGKQLLLSRLKSGYRLKPNRQERPLLDRAALHAEQLTLPHPVTSELLTITAPLPKDLLVALKYLRRYATAGGPSLEGSEEVSSDE